MVSLINTFPDFTAPGFDMERYNSFFKTTNSVINATAADVAYKEHWGCLSIKCAFGGNEFYQIQKRVHAVNETNFLILNEGQYYSSYIFSKDPVESFTLNFTQGFAEQLFAGITNSNAALLDDPVNNSAIPLFIEKLYQHDATISPIIFAIKNLSKDFNTNRHAITELYYQLLEKLFELNNRVTKEINTVEADRYSTRQELYKRLHYAKDYIDSCYANEISLDDLAAVTFMNPAHFLRQFRKYFHATPYQYLVQKRINVAAIMLKETFLPVTDICNEVGYSDLSSFIKLFKKYYTLSPEAYRNKTS